jgi:hypothetical protein
MPPAGRGSGFARRPTSSPPRCENGLPQRGSADKLTLADGDHIPISAVAKPAVEGSRSDIKRSHRLISVEEGWAASCEDRADQFALPAVSLRVVWRHCTVGVGNGPGHRLSLATRTAVRGR